MREGLGGRHICRGELRQLSTSLILFSDAYNDAEGVF